MNTCEYLVYTNNSQTAAPEIFDEATSKKGNLIDQPYIILAPQPQYEIYPNKAEPPIEVNPFDVLIG